jgi:hypothetical protein
VRFISLVRLALTLITAGASHAGARNVLERFYAPELRPIPGDITVHPGFLSTLEFYGPVQNVYSGRQANLNISVEGTKVFLGARILDGLTDLQVEVEGSTLLFRVNIESPGTGPHLYEILRERPQPALVDPLEPRSAPKNLRRNLTFEVVGVSPISDGIASIFFTFANRSQAVVALDTARPRVTQFGATLPFEVNKQPIRQLVEPGETHSGFLAVQGMQAGPAELSWAVQELQGQTREVVFDETVQVPTPGR